MSEDELIKYQNEYGDESFTAGIGAEAILEILKNINLEQEREMLVKNINDLYQSVDALIHPSIYEGLPNVICEAMILGCCVIASNVCDHPVILNDERGLLFDPRSPKSISKSIEEFKKSKAAKDIQKTFPDAKLIDFKDKE